MKTKYELTETDKAFIIKNRLKKSMNEFADFLEKPRSRVRAFMIENNLQLSQEQVKELKHKNQHGSGKKVRVPKQENYVPPKWVPDPWNHGLNPVTMLQELKTSESRKIVYDYIIN